MKGAKQRYKGAASEKKIVLQCKMIKKTSNQDTTMFVVKNYIISCDKVDNVCESIISQYSVNSKYLK